MVSSKRLPLRTRTYSSRTERCTSSLRYRTPTSSTPTTSSTYRSKVSAALTSGPTVMPSPTLPTDLSSILSSPVGSTRKRAPRSSTAALKSLPRFPLEIGCGPGSGSCPSTVCMDNGLSPERSILQNPAVTTTATHKGATTLSQALFIGDRILPMMLGGGPM